MLKKMQPLSQCMRCGTCCRKGGPSFHHSDKPLIESGKIQCRDIYTIRKGEMAYDNVRGYLHPQPSDIIKIRSREDSETCIFFSEEDNSCTVYEHRPLECRVLNCRDTGEIEKIYSENRLGRKDILETAPGLWELILAHQQYCDYEKILTDIRNLKKGNTEVCGQIGESVQYDIHLRTQMSEKGKGDMTDFLFGRPLWKTLKPLGLIISMDGEKICIRPSAAFGLPR